MASGPSQALTISLSGLEYTYSPTTFWANPNALGAAFALINIQVVGEAQHQNLLKQFDADIAAGFKIQPVHQDLARCGTFALYDSAEAKLTAAGEDAPQIDELQHFIRRPRGPSYWSWVLSNASRLPHWTYDSFRARECTRQQLEMHVMKLQDSMESGQGELRLVFLVQHHSQSNTYRIVPAYNEYPAPASKAHVVFVLCCKPHAHSVERYAGFTKQASTVNQAAVTASFARDPSLDFPVRNRRVRWSMGFLPTKLQTAYLGGDLNADPHWRVPQTIRTPLARSMIAFCLGVRETSTIRKRAEHGRRDAAQDAFFSQHLTNANTHVSRLLPPPLWQSMLPAQAAQPAQVALATQALQPAQAVQPAQPQVVGNTGTAPQPPFPLPYVAPPRGLVASLAAGLQDATNTSDVVRRSLSLAFCVTVNKDNARLASDPANAQIIRDNSNAIAVTLAGGFGDYLDSDDATPTAIQPAMTQAEPSTTQANPVTTQAEPATTQDEPSTTEAELVTTQAEPATTQAEPSTTQAEPETSGGQKRKAQDEPGTAARPSQGRRLDPQNASDEVSDDDTVSDDGTIIDEEMEALFKDSNDEASVDEHDDAGNEGSVVAGDKSVDEGTIIQGEFTSHGTAPNGDAIDSGAAVFEQDRAGGQGFHIGDRATSGEVINAAGNEGDDTNEDKASSDGTISDDGEAAGDDNEMDTEIEDGEERSVTPEPRDETVEHPRTLTDLERVALMEAQTILMDHERRQTADQATIIASLSRENWHYPVDDIENLEWPQMPYPPRFWAGVPIKRSEYDARGHWN